MNIYEELCKKQTKKQFRQIANFIGKDKSCFAELMKLFWGDDIQITHKAAVVLELCIEQHPELIQPWIKKMLLHLEKTNLTDALVRNTLRTLQFVDIPDSLLGVTADKCFQLLSDKSQAVAIRVYSMTVLCNICRKEPDLKNELKLLIEEQYEYSSAAFKSRAKRTLKELDKQF